MAVKKRTSVPKSVAAELDHANLHTCCWCRAPRQPEEIHHINGDPTDHRPSNLAMLCRNCHGLVEQSGPLGRRIGPDLVRKAKREWEAECAAGGQLEPVEDDHEEVLVRGGEHRDDWIYSLSEGDLLTVGMVSDVAVTVMIARESDYGRWCKGREIVCLAIREDVFDCELDYEAERDNSYVLWIENTQDEDAIVEVDVAVW